MSYRLALEEVQHFVEALYKKHHKPELFYHNLDHANNIAHAATEIANHYQLSDRDFFVVLAAAWFHDIGYLDKAEGHEQRGADEAAVFLASQHIGDADIEDVKRCILATKIPQNPVGLLQQIICDADLFHFGTENFTAYDKLMRKEAKAFGKVMSKEEWRAKTIQLLQQHHYFTDYCRNLLEPVKQQHLQALLMKQSHQGEAPATGNIAEEKPVESETKKPKKQDRPDRGIETMFRISSSNHQRLSDMADNKSHILITVNSIIISVVASLLLRKLDTNDYLIIPAILLLLVSLVTIVLSILATRPNIPNGTFTQEDLDEKKTNLLFFGNFYRMSLESYAEGMRKLMTDSDFLYGSLIRDVYSQGVVLGKKYKLLRVAYNIFMYGLVVSVIAFIIASLLSATTTVI